MCWIWLIAGWLVGAINCYFFLWCWKKPDGQLRIDSTNPDKDIYQLRVDNLDIIPLKDRIILKVIPNAIISDGSQE